LQLENDYFFSTFEGAHLEWELKTVSTSGRGAEKLEVTAEGQVSLPVIGPQAKGSLKLPLPQNWKNHDVLVVRAKGTEGEELMEWSWPLRSDSVAPAQAANRGIEQTGPMRFRAGGVSWTFDPANGRLLHCLTDGKATGLANGPVLYAGTGDGALALEGEWQVDVERKNETVVLVSSQAGSGSSFSWTLYPDGQAALDYAFAPPEEALTYCAVGFDLPEENVAAKRWLGDGPYRIWANRLQGPQYGLWENVYNDTIPGVTWDYPAFKGVFGEVDWMALKLKSRCSLLVQPAGLADVGVLRPANEPDVSRGKGGSGGPRNATWAYPESGGLFLFHKVPAVGTKFKAAADLGTAEPAATFG
jgi:hypothetical protein